MQIKIEIDVKPEELRRFLGLPDVAGLQDDVVQFLREKIGSASENFDPAAFVRGNLDMLKRVPAWRKLMDTLGPQKEPQKEPETGAEPEAPVSAAPKKRKPASRSKKRTAAAKPRSRRR